MNAHVLRKKSLAKNLIFLLLPVLILLVSGCQCLSAAAPSSIVLSKMFGDSNHPANDYVQNLAKSPFETEVSDANHFPNVPKQTNSQKFTLTIHNSNEKPTQLNAIHAVNGAEVSSLARRLFNYHGSNKPIHSEMTIHPNDNVLSEFVTNDLSRKRNENASLNRLSLQQRIKRVKHDSLRKSLQKQLRVLPKTTNNNNFSNNINSNDSIKHNSSNHKSNIFYNWNNEHNNNSNNKYNEFIAIENRNTHNEQRKEDASKTIASFNSHSNRILSDNDETESQHQQKIERNRRESRLELKQANGAMSRHNQFSNSRINGLPFGNANSPRPRRFCSARDPTTLAFEAPTVFEGKVRSMSSDRRRNFSVTFEVKEIYKRQIGLKLPSLIRLKFTYKNSSECDIYRETFRSVGHIRDELEPGKLYILFVNQIDIGNFTILGQPVKRTRKTVTDVRTGVAEKYDDYDYVRPTSSQLDSGAGQRAYIESLIANNATIREGKRLRIVCKVRGHPPPKVTWFKDDKSINKNRLRYQFVHLRRRSELVIKSAFVNDSGQYECRAKNKLARQPIRKFTRIDVLPKAQEYTRHSYQSNWNHSGSSCPVIGNAFCLNGGTCVFFKDVGEPACKCPDGFLGNRCETKNPTNIHSSTYRNNQDLRQQQHHCGDNNFYGSYYC